MNKLKVFCVILAVLLLLCGCDEHVTEPTDGTAATGASKTTAPSETETTEPTDPVVTEPPTEPTVTEPAPTETEPAPTEPAPTEPEVVYTPPELPEDLPTVNLKKNFSGTQQISENTLLYLHNGYLETLDVGPVQTFTFSQEGYGEYTVSHLVEYYLYDYGALAGNVTYTGNDPFFHDYWFASSLGYNSPFLKIMINRQGSETAFLLDTRTGETVNYMEALNSSIRGRISAQTYTKDGKMALIEVSDWYGYLFKCETGEATKIPTAEDVCVVELDFLDEQTVLVYSYLGISEEENYYTLSKYDIATGKLYALPGKYNGNGVASEYIDVSSAPLAVTTSSGYLSIYDLRTLARCVTPFPMELVTNTFYCGNDTLGVVCQDVLYLVAPSGEITPICRIGSADS